MNYSYLIRIKASEVMIGDSIFGEDMHHDHEIVSVFDDGFVGGIGFVLLDENRQTITTSPIPHDEMIRIWRTKE